MRLEWRKGGGPYGRAPRPRNSGNSHDTEQSPALLCGRGSLNNPTTADLPSICRITPRVWSADQTRPGANGQHSALAGCGGHCGMDTPPAHPTP
jgi:hypothetical protein